MMKRIYYTYPVLLVWLVSTLLPQFCIAMPNEQKENNDVVIENAEMRLIISNDGKARSLIHKATGEECLITNADVPLCAITQYRPYDNENFLQSHAPSQPIKLNVTEMNYV